MVSSRPLFFLARMSRLGEDEQTGQRLPSCGNIGVNQFVRHEDRVAYQTKQQVLENETAVCRGNEPEQGRIRFAERVGCGAEEG